MVLRYYMLNFFDFGELGDDYTSRLAKEPCDYRRIFSRTMELVKLPFSLVNKFTYRANYDDFKVKIPLGYGRFDMHGCIKVSSEDSGFLECFFYWDAMDMTDRIPEFSFSIFDVESREMLAKMTFEKGEDYVAYARESIRQENFEAAWGSDFVERSKFADGRQYELELAFKGFASLD